MFKQDLKKNSRNVLEHTQKEKQTGVLKTVLAMWMITLGRSASVEQRFQKGRMKNWKVV